MTMSFEDLSLEMLVEIFSHYIESEGQFKFLKNVVPVCSTWWNLSRTPSLWKSIDVDLNYLVSFSRRGLLNLAESLNIRGTLPMILLDPDHLLAVLSNIPNLKSLLISWYFIDANTMRIVAEHCPNLESLRIVCVNRRTGRSIRPEELSPILTTCGPKLKRLYLICHVANGEQMISEIATKCTALEVFDWNSYKFPVYELMRGCPRLRKLKLSDCEFVIADENHCSGFNDLTAFVASYCNFQGLDVCSLLKNSNDLKHLELTCNANFIFKDVSKIPSNKVEFLKICVHDDICMDIEALKQAVNKWKHTLLHLSIRGWKCDVTSVLRTYLDGNQCPKLKVLEIGVESVDQTFLETFKQKCLNLKLLHQHQNANILGSMQPYLPAWGNGIAMSFKN